MNNHIFTLLIITLSLILLIMVLFVIKEAINTKNRDNRFRPAIKYLRSYKDGYAFADNADLSQAVQVLYITSDFIEYSDTGINGKFSKIWTK